MAEQSLSIGSSVRALNPVRILSESEFKALSYDPEKGKVTKGAVEEIRALQAAQSEGLAPQGKIIRGDRGADLAVEVDGSDPVGYSVKAYRDANWLASTRSFGKVVGTLISDPELHLLLDQRSIGASDLQTITERLTGAGVKPSQIVTPSSQNFAPIRVQLPNKSLVNY